METSEKNSMEEEILSYVRDFAEKKIKSVARRIDLDGAVPEEIIKEMAKMGLFSSYIPEAYGGNGLSFTFLIKVIEELSKACPSTALVLDGALTLFAEPVLMFGSEDLKRRYLPKIAAGSVGGLAITEPSAGSDAASIRTKAEKDGDVYRINGSKIFVTNGRISDFFVFDAVTDPSKGNKGITTFVAENKYKGIKVSRDIHKMGIRGSSTVEMVFDDAEIPEENVVGKVNEGFRVVMETLDAGRIGIAAQANGIAAGALEEAISYIKQRKQFGKAISDFEGIQFMIADLGTKLEAARLLTYKAASIWDSHKPCIKESSMAKMFASDAAMEITTNCVQLFGGYGFTTDFDAERHMRDAKITQIYEGTNQIQRVIIAREMLKSIR